MKLKKTILRVSIVMLLLLTITGVGHSLAFPQETRCMLIDFYDFEHEEALYYRKDITPEVKQRLKSLIKQAESRVEAFWGQKTAHPKYIYCESPNDYRKFGVPFPSPACVHMKLGTYVVISKDGVDLDILAHEISHAEFYEQIGFFNKLRKIPAWFDEGLAMQVDRRNYYSLDTLKVKSDNFQRLPDVTQMNSYRQFGSGTRDEVMLNYMTAKYLVSKWYSPEKLESLIYQLNSTGGKELFDEF